MRSLSLLIPLLTAGIALALLTSSVPGSLAYMPGAALPAEAGGVILRHSGVSDVTVDVHPTGVPIPPPGAGSTSRNFWVAAGRRGEYREIPTVLVGVTGSFRVWAQDNTDVPPDLMLAAVTQVESAMQSGLLGALLEKAREARSDLFPVDVIYADLRAMGGYFSSADLPGTAHPYSNHTHAIYITLASCNGVSGCSAPLVAHELQHLLQYAVDPQEETWFNEGLAELAEGSPPPEPMECTDFTLFDWSTDPDLTGLHYRSSASFLGFYRDQLGEGALHSVAVDPRPGTESLDAYLREAGDPRTLDDLFLQWSLRQALPWLERASQDTTGAGPCTSRSRHFLDEPGTLSDTVSQYGCDVIAIPGEADAEVRFAGQARAAFLPYLPPQRGATWWSGNRSSSHSTLTAELDLSTMSAPRLRYWTWYDIEEWYDWAYVAVSADGGESWQWLQTEDMTIKDPFGNSPGVGYTGWSVRWRSQEIDLAQYAGMRVLVRFGYITDDAVESIGFSISGAELTDPPTQAALPITDWESQGFRLLPTWNPPTQRFSVLLIEGTGPEDTRPLPLDARNDGHWLLPAGEIRAVMVCGMTAGALPAPYRLTIAYAEEAEPG
ncbi:MAG: hypothetical protein ACOYEW_05000 [Anaerolineae bacterium]